MEHRKEVMLHTVGLVVTSMYTAVAHYDKIPRVQVAIVTFS